MRKAFSRQRRLDCRTILDVELNLQCRDEMVPILRALQHIYAQPQLRGPILARVRQDVNGVARRDRGREGLDDWQILVLAAVRLGCNLDYDKLHDLAEQHRALRNIMGIGDWDQRTHFTWRRIRDNVCLLQPETIEKISHAIVAAGHQLAPEAIKKVRADSFVVETDIHYPTESSLIVDGIRKVLDSYRAQGLDYHALRTRRAGRRRLVELHLLVPGQLSVHEGHRLAEEIEEKIRAVLPGSAVLTHLEPIEDAASYGDQELFR